MIWIWIPIQQTRIWFEVFFFGALLLLLLYFVFKREINSFFNLLIITTHHTKEEEKPTLLFFSLHSPTFFSGNIPQHRKNFSLVKIFTKKFTFSLFFYILLFLYALHTETQTQIHTDKSRNTQKICTFLFSLLLPCQLDWLSRSYKGRQTCWVGKKDISRDSKYIFLLLFPPKKFTIQTYNLL